MIYNTLNVYPFAADYYTTVNTAPNLELPTWEDTFVKTLNINIGSANNYAKLTIYSPEALGIGMLLKNITDANGNLLIQAQPSTIPGIDTTQYRINACDPRPSMFGFIEGYIISAQQLNTLRAI